MRSVQGYFRTVNQHPDQTYDSSISRIRTIILINWWITVIPIMRLKKRGIEKCLVFLYAWRRTLLMGESSQSGPDNGKDTTKNKGVPFTAMAL